MKHTFLSIACAIFLLVSCRPEATIPTSSSPVEEQAAIYPDYRDIVVPPNIAPLNFQIKEAGDEFVGSLQGANGQEIIVAAGSDGKFSIDSVAWRTLLESNRDKDITVTLYAHSGEQWKKYPSYPIHVAAEPIDRYLSYRLIEPGYELYRQLGIYQRDLTGFDVQTIYENNRTFEQENNHCINCHNYQAGNADHMLFHVRSKHGGTVMVNGESVEKLDMKSDSILSGAVYPAWHPTRNWIVFSSNQTGQAFHMRDHQKVEVLDYGSDLIFYDADNHTVANILKTETDMETFPCWSPDGRRLYYCVAHEPELAGKSDEQRIDVAIKNYRKLHYNLMSMDFDPQTRRFGTPRLEIDADSLGTSITLPRVSPDGRYLLFTRGDFGQFHIWHKSSDLWVKDFQTGELRALSAANSPDVESYHSWSSNGRWIVFSSRRDDGSYTRPYIAYFDAQGRDHKPFLLPQEDPEQNLLLLKSYNIPELTRNAVRHSHEKFREVIYGEPKPISYKALPR